MICFDQSTGKLYEYDFVEDYVRIWTKDMKLHEVISYDDWNEKYAIINKLRTWKTLKNSDM